ncbi:hypothetical protein cypCar_00025059, partial [Cyprinus carpio]
LFAKNYRRGRCVSWAGFAGLVFHSMCAHSSRGIFGLAATVALHYYDGIMDFTWRASDSYVVHCPAVSFSTYPADYLESMGGVVDRAGHGWWWVPVFVTCVGAFLGALLYELLIGVHHPDSEPEEAEDLTAVLQQTVELDGMQPKFDFFKENGKDGIFSITSADTG